MASTDYDFILTRNELIEESYRKIGVLSEYQNVSSAQLSSANKKLNLILKKWSEDGVKLWTQIVEEVTLVVDQDYIAVPDTNGMAYVESIQIRDTDSDRELEKINKKEYEQIPEKDLSGNPTMFYHDVILNRVVLWPVPDEAYDLRLYGIKTLKDWETEDDTGELKARWQVAIKYALATELAEDYGKDRREIRDLREVAALEYRLAMNKETQRSENRRVRGAFG
ncbi:MAG: hypothetical protein KBC84_09245 [Proteobacteria bacterium]|nr:hypothetical protein [Pseudomonadota bacterium]